MESLRIIPDLEQAGLRDGPYDVVEITTELTIGGMSSGTQNGLPVVMVAFELDDGSFAVAQTTLALFLGAADVLKTKYGDPR